MPADNPITLTDPDKWLRTQQGSGLTDPDQWMAAQQGSQPGSVGRFLGGAYDTTIGPVVHAVTHPGETARGLQHTLPLNPDALEQAYQHAKNGNWSQAAQSAMDFLAGRPQDVLKGMADPIANRIDQGDYAGAVGAAAGTIGTMAAPEAAGAVKAKMPVLPKVGNVNPTEAAALDYLQEKGVPVPAGTRTGNAFVKNIQKGADSTPLGAVVAQRAQTATTEGLRAQAARLIEDAKPEIPADTHYAAFRQAEADPANIQQVQTGTKQVSTGVVGPNGAPITRTVPITESIPLPANVSSIKTAVQPIYDQISKWWEPAKRNASAGYQAMKSILEGPDVVPASQAEAGLGGLKALAREDTGRNAGIAKFIIPKLQKIVDDAAAQGGPDVVEALQNGRAAAAREVAVDRLTKIFDKAQAEGGFNRQAGIWQDWQRAKSDIGKNLSPGEVSDLDKFFLGAKRLAENPNPSGTATVGISTGAGGLMFTHPAVGIPLTLGAGALSKLLRTPAGIKALSEGAQVSLSPAAKAAAAGRIMSILGGDAQPQSIPAMAQ